MNNKTKIIGLVVLLSVILGLAIWSYGRLSKNYNNQNTTNQNTTNQNTSQNTNQSANTDGKTPYEQLFDVTIYDKQNQSVSLLELANGKPTVINFWASWCGPCKSEMPDFQSVYEEKGDEINFVMINLTDGFRETIKTANKFISNGNFTFPVYYDMDMDASDKYAIFSIPTTFFVNAKGEIVGMRQGVIDKELLNENIDKIL